eukprot:GHVQ01037990.1.p1 GENE.GHVQ01037990.1~~GHVQ01037990.1.p1  ORF type:complete len:249 (+),score=34.90 GHVQ01037990.1:731-1477(+)
MQPSCAAHSPPIVSSSTSTDNDDASLVPSPLGSSPSWPPLEVRPSLIPGAGRGLFVLSAVPKGSVVCEYTGRRLTLLELLRKQDRTYVMGGFGINWHIEAGPEVMARYINDNMDTSQLNAVFQKLKTLRKALVVATRDIASGEELYATYGSVFWRGKHMRDGEQPADIVTKNEASCQDPLKHYPTAGGIVQILETSRGESPKHTQEELQRLKKDDFAAGQPVNEQLVFPTKCCEPEHLSSICAMPSII